MQEFFIKGFLKNYTVKTSMLGNFQGENIAVTISAVVPGFNLGRSRGAIELK